MYFKRIRLEREDGSRDETLIIYQILVIVDVERWIYQVHYTGFSSFVFL